VQNAFYTKINFIFSKYFAPPGPAPWARHDATAHDTHPIGFTSMTRFSDELSNNIARPAHNWLRWIQWLTYTHSRNTQLALVLWQCA